MNEYCWECKKVKHKVNVTGSFLCKECREKQFEYLRKIAGGNGMAENPVDRKKKMDEVKRLLKDTDMAASEIAKKTGIKEATVYYHQKKIRTPDKPETKVKPDDSQKWIKKLNDLQADYKHLEAEYEQLKSQHTKLKENSGALHNEKMKLKEKYFRLQDMYQEVTKKLQEPKEADAEIEWMNKYEKEKAAHDLLIQYVTLIREKTS